MHREHGSSDLNLVLKYILGISEVTALRRLQKGAGLVDLSTFLDDFSVYDRDHAVHL